MITLAMRLQIQIIWLTNTDNIPDALPPEQENLVAAIWSAILLSIELIDYSSIPLQNHHTDE
jgi:hypothetical protein